MSVDDKAIIPVGEADLPIAATSRRHDRSLVPSNALAVKSVLHVSHSIVEYDEGLNDHMDLLAKIVAKSILQKE